MNPGVSRVALSASAAVLMVMTACQRSTGTTAAPAPAPAWQLDESKLTRPIRFSATDIDASKSACQDLVAYANDQWLAANPIPPDQVSWGAFEILADRSLGVRRQLAERAAAQPTPAGVDKIVADIWLTGMDEPKLETQGIAPLQSRLAAIDALTDKASIAAHLRAISAMGENPLFAFGPQADFKDSSQEIAAAFQGGLGLPDTTYYFDADKKPIREAYQQHIGKLLELAGTPVAAATAQAATVLAFETRLARASKSAEQLARDVALYYHPVTLAEADKLTPNFSWTDFFASQDVAAPPMFSLGIPAFHQEVSRMLADVPVAQWQSYLRFKLLDDASPFLNKAFADERFAFYNKTIGGQKEQRPRWKRVLRALEDSAGEAMGQRYVEVAFPATSKARMEELVGNLRDALRVRLQNLEWMGDTTRQKAVEKWSAFTTKIGYPEKWRDWSGLATSRDSYFANVAAAQTFNYRWNIGKIGKPVDKTEWQMTPQEVNAYYDPQRNEIVFPAAILQPPFFDPAADDALNYGSIGAIIGHELTHGYDDQGSRFGPTGNFEQWWTPADAAKFKALTAKLVAQYNGYSAAPGMEQKVNGALTLGENIADLGGLNIAYDALQRATAGKPDAKIDGFTREQRFYLGWATPWRSIARPEYQKMLIASDPHAPDRVRANGTPTNIGSYAAAFGCKDGDAMVNSGAKRVVIW